MIKKVSVVIPNWNGEGLLKKNIPQVCKAVPSGTRIIIIDDGSEDDSVKVIKNLQKNFSNIKLIKNNKNRGFIYSCNKGFSKAAGEFICLLNTDVVPQKGFLEAALGHFSDKKVFAVSFNEGDYGWAKIWWRGGFIHHGTGEGTDRPHISAWASGGSAIFRKDIWDKLGGFDPLYEPFYWEDFDLGFRAWRKGYKIIWEPEARVEHRHESSTSKINKTYTDMIKERNQLLFIWKNIESPLKQIENRLGILLRSLLGPNYIKVFLMARKKYKQAGKPKIKGTEISTKEVISKFKKN